MYPIDRRNLAAHIYEHVRSLRKTGLLLSVSHTTVRRWLICPLRVAYRRDSPKRDIIQGLVVSTVERNPLVTLASLRKLCFDGLGIWVSKELVRVVLSKHGLTRKKARFYGKPHDLETKTAQFIEARAQVMAAGGPVVSIDETSWVRRSATQSVEQRFSSKDDLQG